MKFQNALLFLAILLVVSFGRAAQPESLPPEAETRGGYYEYREWQTRVEDNRVKTKIRARCIILNARADDFAGLAVTEDSYNRFKNLKVRVFDSGGDKLYERNRHDMARSCGYGPSFALYQDLCHYWIDLEGPRYPFAIEYEYETEARSAFFFRGATFQSWLPVQRAVYRLTYPADLPLHARVCGLDLPPAVETDGDDSVYTWEALDLPGTPNENYVPAQSAEPVNLEFSPHRFELEGFEFTDWSWDGVARWYRELAADRYLETEPSTESRGAEELRAAARAAYEKVIGENRYVAVSVGIGSWQPHEAEFTQEKAYGDCKDLTTLLISYLAAEGVTAWPVLVLTRDEGVIDAEFPGFDFNHMITAAVIAGDTLWMDPTCDLCPFGELPEVDENIDVLLIHADGGTVVRTPRSTAADNTFERTTVLTVEAGYDVSFRSDWVLTGNMARDMDFLRTTADREEIRSLIEALLSTRGANYTADSVFAERTGDNARLEVHVAGRSKRPAREIGGTIYVSPRVYRDFITPSNLELPGRTLPVDFGYPYRLKDSVSVVWDAGPLPADIQAPHSGSTSCAFAACRQEASLDSTTSAVQVAATVDYNDYYLPVDQFDEYQHFWEESDFRDEYVKFRLTESGK